MPRHFLSDEELVNGCLAGNKKSWDIFVERYAKLIYWSIRKTLNASAFSKRAHWVDEIFQEVFEKFLENNILASLENVKSLKGFICITACHLTLDKIKAASRREIKSVSIEAGVLLESLDPASQALSKEKETLVENALGGLSEKERFCIELHYLEGRTHNEISGILGLPQDTVSTIIRRSKEKMKKSFEEKGFLE